jgi:hypothetical protein
MSSHTSLSPWRMVFDLLTKRGMMQLDSAASGMTGAIIVTVRLEVHAQLQQVVRLD